MNLNELQNAGDRITDAVNQAVKSGNYGDLSNEIMTGVTEITNGLSMGLSDSIKSAILGGNDRKNTPPAVREPFGTPYVSPAQEKRRQEKLALLVKDVTPQKDGQPYWMTRQQMGQKDCPDWLRKEELTLPIQAEKNRRNYFFRQGWKILSPYYGMGQLIAGVMMALGSGIFALALFWVGLMLRYIFSKGVSAGSGVGLLVAAALFELIFIGSVVLGVKGGRMRRLYKKYQKLGRICGTGDYMRLSDLSRDGGGPVPQMAEDLKKMTKSGFLPDSHFDAQEETLILTRETYLHYLLTEKFRQEEASLGEAMRRNLDQAKNAPEARMVLEEGEKYLEEVHVCKERISDPEMRQKIEKLENITGKIFDEVKKRPESASGLRKFMSYYLPTTLKLLNAYADLSEREEIGDNIREAKKEISESLTGINQAFEKLFDSLFEDVSWDISSDISVMKTMMAHDGLSEDDLIVQEKTVE